MQKMQIHKIIIFVKSLIKGILVIIFLAILIFKSYFGNFYGINACIFLDFLGHRNPSPSDDVLPATEVCNIPPFAQTMIGAGAVL
jgi:hypothetical protein